MPVLAGLTHLETRSESVLCDRGATGSTVEGIHGRLSGTRVGVKIDDSCPVLAKTGRFRKVDETFLYIKTKQLRGRESSHLLMHSPKTFHDQGGLQTGTSIAVQVSHMVDRKSVT